MKLQFDAEKMSIKNRDKSIINQLKDIEEKWCNLKNNKKIKIHVKNNHWASRLISY